MLEDDAAAQIAAVAFAGETLKHSPESLWKKGQWRVEVTNQQGALLFTVITLAVDAPVPGKLPRIASPASND
ncbi:DUF6894 family protein [Sphingomonas ginkgonis]|uniref:DUF6894 family protein n=1 Tax=Sphingomonas ginkgonis TaxID=2315330 RepID=UPI003B83447D